MTFRCLFYVMVSLFLVNDSVFEAVVPFFWYVGLMREEEEDGEDEEGGENNASVNVFTQQYRGKKLSKFKLPLRSI